MFQVEPAPVTVYCSSRTKGLSEGAAASSVQRGAVFDGKRARTRTTNQNRVVRRQAGARAGHHHRAARAFVIPDCREGSGQRAASPDREHPCRVWSAISMA